MKYKNETVLFSDVLNSNYPRENMTKFKPS